MNTRVGMTALAACLLLAAGCARKVPSPPVHTVPADVRDAIGEWMTLVAQALPGTTADSLVFVGGGRMPIAYRQDPRDGASGFDPRRDPELEWSPDGRHWLDPNLYRDVPAGAVEPEYDADSAPVLGDARDGSSAVLEVVGPSMRHEDARWLDAQRFVWLESTEIERDDPGAPRWFRWSVTLTDLRDSTRVTWATRDSANEAAFARWSRAIDAFVVARVQARREALARQ